jgi:hypothetical protein
VVPGAQLTDVLEELEVANDYYCGDDRRQRLAMGLARLADALRVEAA